MSTVQPPTKNLFGDVHYKEAVCAGKQPEWWQPTSGQDKGLKVRNSLTSTEEKRLDPFVPGFGNRVLWYTCGPTVYDSCHMGHARAYLTFDILRRITEEYFKYDVLYHINITDVDDKIIKRARINHLLKTFENDVKDFDAVLKKVQTAMAKKKAELAAKDDTLRNTPAENSRQKNEKKEELEVLALKMQKFSEHEAAVAAIASAEKKGNAAALINAGREELGELLDMEGGASVTDHSIFDEHSKKYEREYFEDMEALGVKEPDVLTRVTEYIPKIVDFIKKIVDKGLAYEGEGSVYLSIADFKKAGHKYRKLVPGVDTTKAEMAEGEGALGDDTGKRHPNDFALWKKSKSGEPSWDSPWGPGRPGWHIECSVVASDILGPVMDIHAGGVDLKFPHHDNELAQSESCFGHGQWVNYFYHAGHLKIKGLKMSKSLKNFVTIREALEKFTPREIRMMFLLQSWWKEMNFSDQTVEEAQTKEKTFREFFHKVEGLIRRTDSNQAVGFLQHEHDKALMAQLFEAQEAVDAAFKDNYDTPTAVLALYKLVGFFNKYESEVATPCVHLVKKLAVYITSIFRILGLVDGADDIGFGSKGEGGDKKSIAGPFLDSFVEFRTKVRHAARAKDFDAKKILTACDEVRDAALPPLGVQLDDLEDGSTVWKLEDPELLMREAQAKREATAAAARKKLEGKRDKLQQEVDKMTAVLAIGDPTAMFNSQEQYKGFKFDDTGIPTHDATETALPKSNIKKLTKERDNQAKALNSLSEKAAKAQKDVDGFAADLKAELQQIKNELRAME